jgi:glycosyltransferase involved in cell wall biosynthesis
MKVLFLCAWFPYPPENGSKIRIYHLLRSLAQDHEIHLLSFIREGERIDLVSLKRLCGSIETVPWREFDPRRLTALFSFFSIKPRSVIDTYSKEMAEKVQQAIKTKQPDVIVACQESTARYVVQYLDYIRIFEEVELGLVQQNWSNNSSLIFRLRRKINWAKITRYTKDIVLSFNACTVVSESERTLLGQVIPNYTSIHVIPNGVDLERLHLGLAKPQINTLIYNGALTFSANYDAMHFFLTEIWPLIHSVIPHVRLKITGRTIGVNLLGLPLDDRVTLTGYLEDIRPAVAGSWACIVPLRVGGGTRLKILEAMALGTPVVSTSKGAEGLIVNPGLDILIADSPTEFADQVVRLMRDPKLHDRISQNGRQLVEKHYGWDVLGQKFTQMLDTLVNSRNN